MHVIYRFGSLAICAFFAAMEICITSSLTFYSSLRIAWDGRIHFFLY